MASTYSTNLKIELMGAGDQVGSWGATTNDNLGVALEEAIVGRGAVQFTNDTNLTISLSDSNASQLARNFFLYVTSTVTLSTQRDLIVPTIEKTYTVHNATTGGQAIRVKTSAGTGVVVPSGKKMILYVDGTNVVEQINYATTLDIGTLSITTPLPVASGGTGSGTASGARTNLGLGTIATQNANSVSITGGSITGITDLAIADGGTGASDAAGARNNLGLGSIATQNANNVSISGGTISGVTISGITDLAVADGGTGSSSLAANNVLLGNGTSPLQVVAPGTAKNTLTSNGTTWVSESPFTTGMIMLWSGSIASIPSGWALCNGSSGTPDLRNRFVVGAGSSYAVGATGGATTVSLSTANMPAHTHSFAASGSTAGQSVDHTHTFSATTSNAGTHSHSINDPGHAHSTEYPYAAASAPAPFDANVSGTPNNRFWQGVNANTTGISINSAGDHNHSVSGTTSIGSTNHVHGYSFSGTTGSEGSGSAFSILPPYYALAYIMKT